MKEYTLKETTYKLRYHDLPGEKTPIVFIHGLGCAGSFDYPEVAAQPEISEHRRILVDLLGAGFSDKPRNFNYTIKAHAQYLLAFINDLNLDQVILFGHSLGGSIVLNLAALCESKITSVILTEANLDSGGGFTTKAIAAYSQAEFVKTGFDKLIQDSRHADNAIWAASFSLWLPEAAYQASKAAVAGQSPSWREILYSLNCSKTFIFGEKNLADPDVTTLAQKQINVSVVEDAGHSMAWENPQALARGIKKAISMPVLDVSKDRT